MSPIHQIYCTHCTHGSSALERRRGELAHRVLGYSARAGSMEGDRLRTAYRKIERYIYYYLPRDTPGDEKLRATARLAPRRLIFLPSTGGLQAIAHVSYRTTDTQGRPGCYFAHVLLREEKDRSPRWSPQESLPLWGARGWVEEDSPDIPFLLPPLESLEEVLRGRRPAIDEQVLLSFLTSGADGSFDDPGKVIPQRWRDKPPQQRVDALVEALDGLLKAGGSAAGSLLMVAEPPLAALIFYGIARLLPAVDFCRRIGFSTYEPNPERMATVLAATTFFDPLRTDLRSEAYRARGLAINTFLDRRSQRRAVGNGRLESSYAATIVHRLLDEGWPSTDWRLGLFPVVGVRSVEDLHHLAAADRLARALLANPKGNSKASTKGDSKSDSPRSWPTKPMARNYLRTVLGRRLTAIDRPGQVLTPLIGSPHHLPLLDLLAAEPEIPATRAAIEFLMRELPAEKIADLLALKTLSPRVQIDVLRRHVASSARLPSGCEWIWDHPASFATPPDRRHRPLLPGLLDQLDDAAVEAFYRNVAPQHAAGFVAGLIETCRQHPARRAALTRIVGSMDPDLLVTLYQGYGPSFFTQYPDGEPALAERLGKILHTLPGHVSQFSGRLDTVLAGRDFLPDNDQSVASSWQRCRAAILNIGELQQRPCGVFRGPAVGRLEIACRKMAEAARLAMPDERFDGAAPYVARQQHLRRIGRHLLAGRHLMPSGVWRYEALWQKIAWCFRTGEWPTAPLRKMHPGSGRRFSSWLAVALLLAAAVAGLVVVSGIIRHVVSTQDVQRPGTPFGGGRRQPPSETGPEAPSPEPERESQRGLSNDQTARSRSKSADEPEHGPPKLPALARPAALEPRDNAFRNIPLKAPPNVPKRTAGPTATDRHSSDPTAAKPLPPTRSPQATKPVAPPAPPFIAGESSVLWNAVKDVQPSAVVVVRLVIRGTKRRLLPDWCREKFIVGCLLRFESDHGVVQPPVEITDVTVENRVRVPNGIDRVFVQFRFARRPQNHLEQKYRPVGVTIAYPIDPIVRKSQYTMILKLGKAGFEQLHKLAEK